MAVVSEVVGCLVMATVATYFLAVMTASSVP